MAVDTTYSTLSGYITSGICFAGDEPLASMARILLNKLNAVAIDTDTDGNVRVLKDAALSGALSVIGALDVGAGHFTVAAATGNIVSGTINGITVTGSGTVATSASKLSVFAATTSLELKGVISDETGSGALVFASTPTLVTPVLGAATGTSLAVSGDVESTTTTNGLILRAPDAGRWRLTVDNSGVITTTVI